MYQFKIAQDLHGWAKVGDSWKDNHSASKKILREGKNCWMMLLHAYVVVVRASKLTTTCSHSSNPNLGNQTRHTHTQVRVSSNVSMYISCISVWVLVQMLVTGQANMYG